MSSFIWVRDKNKNSHYVNVDYIIRVTKIPAAPPYGEYSYIVLQGIDKHIDLSNDEYDTYDEVIAKIKHVESMS
jgi:hypothetical protein